MDGGYDILIVGTGLAGLTLALKTASFGKVALLSKSKSNQTNTWLAQGGVASAISPSDSINKHIKDTLVAGAGLCYEPAVKNIIEQGPDRINELINWGVPFDKHDGDLSLTKEGAHSERRILHVQDQTGRSIHQSLMELVKKHPNISIYEEKFVVDLILNHHVQKFNTQSAKCIGAYILDKNSKKVSPVLAQKVVLATGGAGKAYLYTSNWSGATGDGLALAYRAGARVANLEFMQFHPTCLYHPQSRNFLISEALRGEGGVLVDKTGRKFMTDYHPLGSLAPRDIVARSIDAEMKKSGDDCVYLDITKKTREYLKNRFPVIYEKCLSLGIDIATAPIPVVPAAHYNCGGVLTDTNGATDIENLYAVGETGCTGLHGANRLASNSLLECLGVSHNASLHIKNNWGQTPDLPIPEWTHHHFLDNDELNMISCMWDEIRRLMWSYVGIVRSNKRLLRAQHRINNIQLEIKEFYSNFKTHPEIEELRNIALVAELTIESALKRKNSIGIHYNIDSQKQLQSPTDTIVKSGMKSLSL